MSGSEELLNSEEIEAEVLRGLKGEMVETIWKMRRILHKCRRI
jgi:hypothetical protein